MARTAKVPQYDDFNNSRIGFGTHGKEPSLWRTILDPEIQLNLELGCGRAEVSLALAEKYKEENFIGVDLKADRLWKAVKNAEAKKLDNVAFIQEDVSRLDEFIFKDSVKMIWITHPDPYGKAKHEKRRLLNRNFLDLYKKVLVHGGVVRFKTDDRKLYDWALELLEGQNDVSIMQKSNDLYGDFHDEDITVVTAYSKKFMDKGVKINYIEFTFI